MIPKMHARGQSFRDACAYVLHDAEQAKTNDRVSFAMTANLATKDPKWAWHEMVETYWAQDALKAAAGRDARGRKNTKPVLHYTLSWADTETPSPEHMKEAALSSLKAIGLGDHEALIVGHNDKKHLHVHIVVNTVHPQTGMTAPLKFPKLALSKWAEAYEREHGIHCEERVRNNAEREAAAAARKLLMASGDQLSPDIPLVDRNDLGRATDPSSILMAQGKQHDGKAPVVPLDPSRLLMAVDNSQSQQVKPYAPVKHQATNRKLWFDRKEVIDRMKQMRAALDTDLKSNRDAMAVRQSMERDALDARSDAADATLRDRVRAQYKPLWRNLYNAQRRELKHVRIISGNLLDRAVYVYQNRARLGVAGKALTPKQMLPLIRSAAKLQTRVAGIHEQERRALAREAKAETKALTGKVWSQHRADMDALRANHARERQQVKDAQGVQRKSISFDLAKASLSAERVAEPRAFHRPLAPKQAPEVKESAPAVEHEFKAAAAPETPPASLSRSEQIKRDMEDWRKRNDGQDPGREL